MVLNMIREVNRMAEYESVAEITLHKQQIKVQKIIGTNRLVVDAIEVCKALGYAGATSPKFDIKLWAKSVAPDYYEDADKKILLYVKDVYDWERTQAAHRTTRTKMTTDARESLKGLLVQHDAKMLDVKQGPSECKASIKKDTVYVYMRDPRNNIVHYNVKSVNTEGMVYTIVTASETYNYQIPDIFRVVSFLL